MSRCILKCQSRLEWSIRREYLEGKFKHIAPKMINLLWWTEEKLLSTFQFNRIFPVDKYLVNIKLTESYWQGLVTILYVLFWREVSKVWLNMFV